MAHALLGISSMGPRDAKVRGGGRVCVWVKVRVRVTVRVRLKVIVRVRFRAWVGLGSGLGLGSCAKPDGSVTCGACAAGHALDGSKGCKGKGWCWG